MARIRNARTVNCPICKATRFAGARAEGLTEEIVDQIRDGYDTSEFAPRHKVVLAWVDAFLTDPAGSHKDLHRQLLAHFTPAQIV